MSPIAEYDLGTARGRIEIDSSSIGSAGDAFVSTGRMMMLGGAAMTAGLVSAVSAAASFERQMSAVEAVSGATASQMEELSQKALDIGTTSLYGAEEVGRAMEQLAKAGIGMEDILGGATEATINLAQAAGDELAGGVDEAAVVLANAMKTFGATVGELDHYANVIVGAAAASTLSVDDLAVSLKYAGPIASALGFSIDDLSTTLAILGDRGIRGSTAGTSLRGVLLSLTPSSDKAANAMKELGLITADGTNQFYNLDGSLKSMPEVMDILGNSIKDLSEQEKVAAFNAIFQRRAMNSALILAEQGADGFHTYSEAIAALDASDIAATKLDNLSGDMTILKNTAQTMLIEVGRPLQDMFRSWVQGLTDLLYQLREVDTELLSQIVLWTGIAGVVVTAIGSFLFFVGIALRLYQNFILLKAAIGTVMGLLAANPIVLIIAAIALLATALYLAYQRFEWFRDGVNGAFERIKEVARNVADALSRFFQDKVLPAWDRVKAAAGELAEVVGRHMSSLRDWGAEHIGPVFSALGDLFAAVVDRISRVFSSLMPTFRAIGSFFSVWFEALKNIFTVVIEILVHAWELFGDNILRAARAVWELIKSTVENGLQFIEGIIKVVTGIIAGDWGKVWDGMGIVLGAILKQIGAIIEFAFDMFLNLVSVGMDLIRLVWHHAWDLIKAIVSGAWNIMVEVVRVGFNLIKAIFDGVLSTLRSLWDAAWAAMGRLLSSAWNGMKTAVSAALGEIMAWFGRLPQQLRDKLNSLPGLLAAAGREALSIASGLLKGLSQAFATVVSWLGGLPRRMVSALGDFANILLDVGYEIIMGLKRGAERAWANTKNWFAQRAEDIKGIFSRTLVIASPSRVMADIGDDIMAGLQLGLERSLPDVYDVLRSVSPTIVGTVSGTDLTGSFSGRALGTASSNSTTVVNEFNGDVIIPVSELQDVKDVKDFFDRIKQASRQGGGVL